MSDFLHAIFGGGSSQSNQQATSTPINFTNPSLQGLGGPLGGSLSQLLQQWSAGGAGPQYGGQLTAGPTSNETNLLNSSALTAPGAASSDYIKNVLSGSYLPGSPNQNPFLAGAITAAQRPTLDNLENTLSSSLPGQFAAAGQSTQPNNTGRGGSSAFDLAAAKVFQSAANTSTDIASNIGSSAYNSERQNQNVAAGLDQQEVGTTVQALQAQALPRLIQQYGLDQGVKLFQSGITNLLSLLQTIGQVQNPVLGNASQSTGNSTASQDKGIFPDLFPKGA